MMRKLLTVLFIGMAAAACGACRSRYSSPTFKTTDSYAGVFEGKYIPTEVR